MRKIMEELLSLWGIKATYLARGSYAVAFISGCGTRVHKLTQDTDDALQALNIMGTKPKFFAHVYNVMEITLENLSCPLFYIETEYYEPMDVNLDNVKYLMQEEMIKYGFIQVDINKNNFGVDKEGNVRCFDFGYNSSSRLYENANFKKYDLHRQEW